MVIFLFDRNSQQMGILEPISKVPTYTHTACTTNGFLYIQLFLPVYICNKMEGDEPRHCRYVNKKLIKKTRIFCKNSWKTYVDKP